MRNSALNEPGTPPCGGSRPESGSSRRRFITTALGGIAGASLGHAPAFGQRGAPNVHTIKLGDIEISILSDGNLMMPAPLLATNAEPAALKAVMAMVGQAGERVAPPCNITLVRMGSETVLIDAGAGPHFMPTAGKLVANLEAAGIDKASITKVVYTHAHPDHLWGTLDEFDDSPRFPNASYIIAAAEWNFWADEETEARLPEDRRFFAAPTRKVLRTIKDKVRAIKPGEDIVSGLRAVDTAGHTAGHMAVEIAAGNDAVLVVGDALAHPVIAFAHPDWTPAADHHDAAQAVQTRKRLLERLATDRSRLVGYHLPFPGIGRVERRGTAFAYVAEGA